MSPTRSFSKEALGIISLVETSSENLFITGEAGTGKSTLLEHIVSEFGKDMVVLAPTGIAAINVKGATIHSFFKLKPGYELDEASNMKITKSMTDRYKTVKTILIDEISMVRADLLDAVDVFLKRVRKSREYFGGVRMVFFGDLYQLPPVVTREEDESFHRTYKSPWFFSAKVFEKPDLFTKGFEMKKLWLTHIYRQSDPNFIWVLNAIRNKQAGQPELDYLGQFVVGGRSLPRDDKRIYLVATNEQAARINVARLAELKTKLVESFGQKDGSVGATTPNEMLLRFKEGAQVMFLNNDQERRWVNGSIGTITGYNTDFGDDNTEVLVKLREGKEVSVGLHTWPIARYRFRSGKFEREEIGAFTQLPFKLAWAITIHKSQGKTFEKVLIDLGSGSFAHGQCYVALSRCTGPGGLMLSRPIRHSDMIMDRRIEDFHTGK